MRKSSIIRAMLLALVLVGSSTIAASCGPSSDQVELRLFPCEVGGGEPRSVVVELTGFDADGMTVETFDASFEDISTQVFEDGYATVGYRSDPKVVTARVRIGWFSTAEAGALEDAEALVVYENVDVPALGEVMSLPIGNGDCSPIAGDGDGDPTTTNGDGDGDGDGTPGDGDGTPGDGDGTPGDGDGTPGDGDGDGTPGDGDGTPGDGDGDGSPGDGDGSPGDGDGDPGDGDGAPIDLPMLGDMCSENFMFYCIPEPNGDAGTPVLCQNGTLNANNQFQGACAGLCPMGSSNPVNACAGFGYPAYCMCQPNMAQNCNGAQLGCFNGNQVKLCHNGLVVIGQCNNCSMMGGYYSCTL